MNWLEVDGFRQALETLPSKEKVQIFADACDVNAQRFTQRILADLPQWPWPESRMTSEHKADTRYPVVAMASILAKEERDRSIAAMAARVGFNVGSGYPSDPNTKAALGDLILQSAIDEDVRWGWATVERFGPFIAKEMSPCEVNSVRFNNASSNLKIHAFLEGVSVGWAERDGLDPRRHNAEPHPACCSAERP